MRKRSKMKLLEVVRWPRPLMISNIRFHVLRKANFAHGNSLQFCDSHVRCSHLASWKDFVNIFSVPRSRSFFAIVKFLNAFNTFWQIASVLSPINYTVTGLRVESRLSSSTRRTSKFAISNNQSRPKVLSFCPTRSIINCFMISISMGAVTIIWLPPQTPCEELFEELFFIAGCRAHEPAELHLGGPRESWYSCIAADFYHQPRRHFRT